MKHITNTVMFWESQVIHFRSENRADSRSTTCTSNEPLPQFPDNFGKGTMNTKWNNSSKPEDIENVSTGLNRIDVSGNLHFWTETTPFTHKVILELLKSNLTLVQDFYIVGQTNPSHVSPSRPPVSSPTWVIDVPHDHHISYNYIELKIAAMIDNRNTTRTALMYKYSAGTDSATWNRIRSSVQ